MNPIKALFQVWWARPYYQYTIGEISIGQLIIAIAKRALITLLIMAALGAPTYFSWRSDNKAKFEKIGITEEQLAQKQALMIRDGKYDPNFFLGKKAEENAVDMRIFGKVMGSEHSASFWVPKVNAPLKGQEITTQGNAANPPAVEIASSPKVQILVEITPSEPLQPAPIAVSMNGTSSPAPTTAGKDIQQTWPDATKPGFDCAAARSQVEKLICNDRNLINADSWMSHTYRNAEKTDATVATQKLWLKKRNLCNTSECLLESYSVRIKELSNSGS